MVDDARLALRSRGVAIRAGSRRAPRRRAEKLGAAEELRRIDRSRSFPDLEVQLRGCHVAGLSGMCNHLSPLDRVAALDEQLARMRIGGHISIRVTDQNEITVALALVAGVGNDAVIGRLDGRPVGNGEIDTVILRAVRLAAETGNDAAASGPAKRRHGPAWLRSFDDRFGRLWLFLGDMHGLRRRSARNLDLLLSGSSANLPDLGSCRRLGSCDLMTTLRNGQPVTDAQFLGRINVIGFGKRSHRYTGAAGDAHERVTRLYHVNASTRLRLRGICRRAFRRSRYVARDDQPLTRPDLARFTDAVGLHKGSHRHAVLARDALDRLAVADRHRCTAVPGPMTGSRPRHIGILTAGAR